MPSGASAAAPAAARVLAGVAAALLAGTAAHVNAAAPARAAAVTAVSGGRVSVTGSGYGHGVGMSQYGALGMARAGATATQILRHYYTGVDVAPFRDDVEIRVNVVHAAGSITLGSTARDAGGGGLRLVPDGARPLILATGDTAVLRPVSGQVSVTVRRAGRPEAPLLVAGLAVRWPGTRLLDGAATTADVTSVAAGSGSSGGSARKVRSYRWGSLRVTPVGTGLDTVAVLDLHAEYLLGIDEMPSSWPAAALQAQAVAARNYALVAAASAPRASCGGCQLWDDSRSQVYRGWAKEAEAVGSRRYGDRWVAAVRATQASATSSLAVLYRGRPVTAYFASSTGGRTRDSGDVWGTSLPYLASVADPWSTDPAVNPAYARWTRTVAVERLLSVFALPDLAGLAVMARDSGGAAKAVTATSSSGTRRTVSGDTLRSALGLPGAWITDLTLPGGTAGGASNPVSAPTPPAAPPGASPSGARTSTTTPGPLRRGTVGQDRRS